MVGPAERSGPSVVVLDEGDDPLGEVVAESNSPRRRSRRSKIEKNSPTWLSQLACVGVKCRCTCELASKNAATRGVLCAERLSTMQCRSSPAGVWSTRSAKKAAKRACHDWGFPRCHRRG